MTEEAAIVVQNLALVDDFFRECSREASLKRERELEKRNGSKKRRSNNESDSKAQKQTSPDETTYEIGYASEYYYECRLRDYLRRVYEIRNAIGDILSDYGVKLVSPADQEMTLRKNQIGFNHAVAVVFSNGMPYKFYTPEGEILLSRKNIRVSATRAEAIESEINDRFGLVEMPGYPHHETGPNIVVYALARDINGKPLVSPIPEEKPVRDCCNKKLTDIWRNTRPRELARPKSTHRKSKAMYIGFREG